MVKKIIAAIVVVAVAVGGYLYYLDATAPLETKLDSTDRIAYDILSEGASKFKNPASVRISEGFLSKDKEEITVRLSAENGFGGHETKVYVLKKGGKVDDVNYKGAGEIILESEKLLGTKINAEKINEAFASHHK